MCMLHRRTIFSHHLAKIQAVAPNIQHPALIGLSFSLAVCRHRVFDIFLHGVSRYLGRVITHTRRVSYPVGNETPPCAPRQFVRLETNDNDDAASLLAHSTTRYTKGISVAKQIPKFSASSESLTDALLTLGDYLSRVSVPSPAHFVRHNFPRRRVVD